MDFMFVFGFLTGMFVLWISAVFCNRWIRTQSRLMVISGKKKGRLILLGRGCAIETKNGRVVVKKGVENLVGLSACCRLFLIGNKWWIEGSENHEGTFLNGKRLYQPRPLSDEDAIRISGERGIKFIFNA